MYKIDYNKTIKKGKLVLIPKWFEVIESIMFYVFSLLIIVTIILCSSNANYNSENDTFFTFYIFPIILLFVCWSVYKKVAEKRLLVIKTSLNKKEAREAILKFAKNEGWNIEINNSNYLQANTYNGISHGKQITILYTNTIILLNVLSNNPKLRRPVFFSDKHIQKKMQLFLANERT